VSIAEIAFCGDYVVCCMFNLWQLMPAAAAVVTLNLLDVYSDDDDDVESLRSRTSDRSDLRHSTALVHPVTPSQP